VSAPHTPAASGRGVPPVSGSAVPAAVSSSASAPAAAPSAAPASDPGLPPVSLVAVGVLLTEDALRSGTSPCYVRRA
jgi:hypothetical protein